MFNNSSNIAISRSTFSVVHGDQYNIYHNHLEADGRTPPEDKWKIELYREYRRVPTGDCNLLKMICESPEIEYKYVDDQWEKTVKATRVLSVTRLGSRRNGSRFTSVGYRGRDAKKLFKKDCIDFSQIKHPGVAQLHAFNDSANLMIFFHDELIPLQHIMERYSDCRYVLSQYISFQCYMICDDYVPPFFGDSSQLWVRPQDGTFVWGPKGPRCDAKFPHAYPDIARNSLCRDPVPMPLNLFDSRNLLNYLASWLPEGLIPLFTVRTQVRHPFYSFNPKLVVSSEFPSSSNIIAQFPQSVTDVLSEYGTPPEVLMDDGRMRFQYTRPPWYKEVQVFARNFWDQGDLDTIWVAQASRVFERLKIPREDWESYGLISDMSLMLDISQADTIRLSNNRKIPFYLLVHPCPRFSNGYIDIESLTLASTNICYWSSDPDGNSEMTEEECIALGLPRYLPRVLLHMSTWRVEDYDFMRGFQEAKGFDPTTTDFARSIGMPILEVVDLEEGRFEFLPDKDCISFLLCSI